MLMAALQYVDVPRYSALILRRTKDDLALPGAIGDRADEWLGGTDARLKGSTWEFPSGATITLGSIQYDRDKSRYKSAEFQFIAWDELTQFQETTYTFMFSRLRRPAVICGNCNVMVEKVQPGTRSRGLWGEWGTEVADDDGWVHGAAQTNYDGRCPHPKPSQTALREYAPSPMDGLTLFDVPLRMRAASNPGDVGHAWVRDRFVRPQTRKPGASFYPAKLTDNPSLDQRSYAEGLGLLTTVERQRLLDGDWEIADGGTMFKRSWFDVVPWDVIPKAAKWVRYWDLAATEAKQGVDGKGNRDPDWTAGALVAFHDGHFWVAHILRMRETPGTVERSIVNTSDQDGRAVPIRMEQEPGSSGVNTIDNYRRNILPGRDFDGKRPTGDKAVRASTWSGAAEHGLVHLVGGAWIGDFLDEAEAFPGGAHDDMVDAVSGAVEFLTTARKARLIL
jgi:predicted phage terminase large subunit-like protein